MTDGNNNEKKQSYKANLNGILEALHYFVGKMIELVQPRGPGNMFIYETSLNLPLFRLQNIFHWQDNAAQKKSTPTKAKE